MPATLAAINIFPLKSCAPLPLVQARVLARGLEHDRRWLLVDEESKFITARKCPRLMLVRAVPVDDELQLDAPGMPTLRVRVPDTSRRTSVLIWDDTVSPLAGDDESTAWLSTFLERKCSLVFMDDACARPVDPDRAQVGDEVSFADSHPLLALSKSAVDHLNTRLAKPVLPIRFRPNLLIEGVEAHAEDGWKRIRVGAVEFDVLGPCTRCVITTLDFDTAVFDSGGEPLRTLATYRRSTRGITFGQNLTPRRLGTVRVGDAVEVLA